MNSTWGSPSIIGPTVAAHALGWNTHCNMFAFSGIRNVLAQGMFAEDLLSVSFHSIFSPTMRTMKKTTTLKPMKAKPCSRITVKGPIGRLGDGQYWVADVTVRTITGRLVADFYEFVNFRKARALRAAKKLAKSVRRDFPENHKIHIVIRPANDGCA